MSPERSSRSARTSESPRPSRYVRTSRSSSRDASVRDSSGCDSSVRGVYRGEGLPAVCGVSPRVLILGSFPSVMSLERREYYGNPHNQFWRIMDAVLGIDAALPYSRRVEEMKRRHIALWDAASECLREGSSDSTIRDVAQNDIAGFIDENPSVRAIFLNGRTGAGKIFSRFFKDFSAEFPDVDVLVMPSTSPANAAVSLAEKIECWSAVKGYLDGYTEGSHDRY